MPVPTEAVTWAYRLLLGREPESEDVIRLHTQAESVNRLRRTFLGSKEFFETSRPPSSLMPVKADIEYRADAKTLQRLRE